MEFVNFFLYFTIKWHFLFIFRIVACFQYVTKSAKCEVNHISIQDKKEELCCTEMFYFLNTLTFCILYREMRTFIWGLLKDAGFRRL